MIRNYTNVLRAVMTTCSNWPSIVWAKLCNKSLEYIVLRDGVKIYVGGRIGKADLSMFSEIWHQQIYTPEKFQIEDSATVFDVGANNGYFTAYAAQKASKGKVYAFEPVRHLAEKIRKTVAANNFHNVRIENIGLADRDTRRAFYFSKEHNGCHSLYERKGEMEKVEIVVTTLAGYCKQHDIRTIDFLKLDCEGAEYEIITKESADFLKNHVMRIAMECHDDITNHTHKEIVQILADKGFMVETVNGFLYAQNPSLSHNLSTL